MKPLEHPAVEVRQLREALAHAAERRQAIAADLGYSETVFVDDRETGALEMTFAKSNTPYIEPRVVNLGGMDDKSDDSVACRLPPPPPPELPPQPPPEPPP